MTPGFKPFHTFKMSCTKRQSKFNFLDPLILTCATDATKIQVTVSQCAN